jgi:dTDP-4-amino-4,6-dideoxygalactose transaminase
MTSVTWDRHRGYSQSYDVVDVGFNFRIDEPRAALGLSRLPRLAADVEERRRVVHGYRERLEDRPGIELAWTHEAVDRASHFAFPLLLSDRVARERIRGRLGAQGIQTTWYPAVHGFSDYLARDRRELPRTEEFAGRHLCLPLSPALGDDDLDAICEATIEAALG